MANNRGNILNRTSYDVHQEVNAKVIGVLNQNNKIRESLLRKNIGVYEMAETDEGIGYISPIYSIEHRKPFSLGGDGLLGYTHTNDTDFKKHIHQKYGFNDLISHYRIDSVSIPGFNKKVSNFDDYVEYISNVVGFSVTPLNILADLFKTDKLTSAQNKEYSRDNSLTIRSVLNDFLQYDNIKHAMERDRIGTVTPNPLASLAGAVVTNINNFSGIDTRLGLISNQLYALTLQRGAQFNSLRNTHHISEDVYDGLGNTLLNLPLLGSMGRLDPDTGRLAFEYGDGVQLPIHYESMTIGEFEDMDMIDGSKNIANSRNARYRNLIRNHDKYLPFDNYRYEAPQDFTTLAGYITSVVKLRRYDIWNEGDRGGWITDATHINGDSSYHGVADGKYNDNSLLAKTQTLFSLHNEKSTDTIIGRFHTSGDRDIKHNEAGLLQTAVSKFGMSHGRNLLTKDAYEKNVSRKTNGYDNPYCRTWTYHHQYSQVGDLIRPFSEVDNDGNATFKGLDELQSNWWMYGRRKGSAGRLKDNGTLNKNGFVNITPSGQGESKVDIKKCMFSIENLAWKDVIVGGSSNALSPEQIGPNGGRIMWFPPYALSFNEQVNVNWNSNDFIGRGEKVYTYTNTERGGTLSFMLLVDHPSILDMWKKNGATKDVEKDEQSVLRFFAGCDELKLNNKKIEQKELVIPDRPIQVESTPLVVKNDTEDIVFYVFFPNNYSGIDDNIDDVIQYLSKEYECNESGVSNGKAVYDNYSWQYRVDRDYLDNNMTYKSNYVDNTSYLLNKNKDNVIKSEEFNDATHSFSEISVGKALINKIAEIGGRLQSVVVEGTASSHGYSEINVNELAINRANTIGNWLKRELSGKTNGNNSIFTVKNGGEIDVEDIDKNNISGESAKRGRSVKVVIRVEKVERIKPLENLTTEIGKEHEQPISLSLNPTTIVNSELTKTTARAQRLQKMKESFDQKSKEFTTAQIAGFSQRLFENNTKVLQGTQILNNEEMEELRKEIRWDEEAQYFEMLEANDSVLYSKIVEKIKYFTPAFHSITPEGFNARLGFLHQCTRQGATLGTSDERTGRSAGNMAFGRPPVCVLRIGDFYHTRIVINSVTIDYENPQWDMNQEGIGLQPMMAKVSLNFVFLGGSDLGAPISRLQNAVSFNYYANQSVYDDRADVGIYDNNTAKIQGTPWLPEYKKSK